MSYQPQVIYEDNHLLAVNKRGGEISQGDRTGDKPLPELLKDFIKIRDQKPGNVFMGVVHRLDRPVSGVILFAKTSKALERLNRALRERQLSKSYLAVVGSRPDEPMGSLRHFLRKNNKLNKSRAHRKKVPDSKEAILHYKMIGSIDRYHLLAVKLETGRHHQIRVQLAEMGCPIRGDLKYGAPRSNKDASIHLHAHRLELIHPVRKEPLILNAPLPKDTVWSAFKGWEKEAEIFAKANRPF